MTLKNNPYLQLNRHHNQRKSRTRVCMSIASYLRRKVTHTHILVGRVDRGGARCTVLHCEQSVGSLKTQTGPLASFLDVRQHHMAAARERLTCDLSLYLYASIRVISVN